MVNPGETDQCQLLNVFTEANKPGVQKSHNGESVTH